MDNDEHKAERGEGTRRPESRSVGENGHGQQHHEANQGSLRRSISDSQLSYEGAAHPDYVAVVFDESKRAHSLGSSAERRALKDVLKLDYDAPHLRRNSRDWEWLKGGKVVLKVLPSEVKQVHRKEQPCACSLFSILVGAFLAYLVVLCLQLGQAREKPAQSVTLETDPNRANLLNIFPNVVVCYPSFAGEAEWLPINHKLHSWRKADQDKPELQSHLLDGHNCSLIANANKGRCMFVDASNLQPDMDAALSDRGIELYVAYVREGAKNPRAIGIVYRGAYVSMTVKPYAAWCAQNGEDADLIDWSEAPLDGYQPGNWSYLPYLAMSVEVNRIIRLRRAYNPLNDQDPEHVKFAFVPRTASFHVGSDLHLLHPEAIARVEQAHNRSSGDTPNMNAIPAVGRFILTQGGGVVSYEEIDPVDIPSLFGTIAGAWSGILTLFSCIFVTTASGRRRLPAPLRKSFDSVKSWRRNSRSLSGEGSKFSRMRSQSSMQSDLGEIKADRALDDGGGAAAIMPHGPSEDERARARTRSIKFIDEAEDEPPAIEDRVYKLEQALTAVLQEPWVPAEDAYSLREEVKELRETLRIMRAGSLEGAMEGGGARGAGAGRRGSRAAEGGANSVARLV